MERPDMIFTEYMKDVENYLRSQIIGCPEHVYQSVSAYIANRAMVMTNDVVWSMTRSSKEDIVKRYKDITKLRRELVTNGDSEKV